MQTGVEQMTPRIISNFGKMFDLKIFATKIQAETYAKTLGAAAQLTIWSGNNDAHGLSYYADHREDNHNDLPAATPIAPTRNQRPLNTPAPFTIGPDPENKNASPNHTPQPI